MSTPEKCPYVVCMDTCELLCSGQFVGINSKNARGILEDRMKQKEERNNVMKKANETVVLCGASAYEEKYYLNPDFEQLPDDVKNELKIMCVLYVHDVGGILTLVFEENGELCFEVTSDDFDPMFDDIGSQLKIKQLQRDKQDLLQALQLYYKVFFLGEEINSEE